MLRKICNFRYQSAHTPLVLRAFQNGFIAIIESEGFVCLFVLFFKDIGLKVTVMRKCCTEPAPFFEACLGDAALELCCTT